MGETSLPCISLVGCASQSTGSVHSHLQSVKYGAVDDERQHCSFRDDEVNIEEPGVGSYHIHYSVTLDMDHLGFKSLWGGCKRQNTRGRTRRGWKRERL